MANITEIASAVIHYTIVGGQKTWRMMESFNTLDPRGSMSSFPPVLLSEYS